MRLSLVLLGLAIGVSASLAGHARSGALAAPAEAASQGASETRFDFRSRINRRTYRVKISRPAGAPPAKGFPVIYVLDGDAFFGTFTEATRQRAAAHEGPPCVVVGITYPDESRAGIRRLYDFTNEPPHDEEVSKVEGLSPSTAYGGAKDFLAVILREVEPAVARREPLDPHRRVLFGWSLGGLFVVDTLFHHPAAFSDYVALSPSIWWNNRSVLAAAPEFEREIASQTLSPRIFLGVGGLEQSPPPGLRQGVLTPEQIASLLERTRMVGNVRDLGERLARLNGVNGVRVETEMSVGETHNSEPWAALESVLRFALPLSPGS